MRRGDLSYMNRTLTLILALAAGLLGGTLSRYVTPTTVLAQGRSTAPKEMRAQRFTLVNERGIVLGVFGLDSPEQGSNPTIRLFDENGREIFRAGPPSSRPAGQNSNQSSPLPFIGFCSFL
jgi:hypothetical protein